MLNRCKRPSLFVLMLALAIAATVTVVAVHPAKAVISIYSGHVYNGASTRCLHCGTAANAQPARCSAWIYQQWTYNPRNGQIVRNSPTGCLDAGAGINGTGVPLVTSNGSAYQKWT